MTPSIGGERDAGTPTATPLGPPPVRPTALPGVVHSPADIARYHADGDWGDEAIVDLVRRHRSERPDALALASPDVRLSWSAYDAAAERLAAAFVAAGLEPGDRLAILLPDLPIVHVAYVAAERAGLVVVGISARSGDREIAHLLGRTVARALLTCSRIRDRSAAELAAALAVQGAPAVRSLVLDDAEGPLRDGDLPIVGDPAALAGRRLHPDELSLINATSGTTGLPKCVLHNSSRWIYFGRRVIEAGGLAGDDIVLSVVPMPYGFGLWSSHVVPAQLGAATVLLGRFSVAAMLEAIARERVTVLCCVTTQLAMLLNDPAVQQADCSSLRAIFTGGEAVPVATAERAEALLGAPVLQFYGSNEAGALSCTTVADDRAHRHGTAGRAIEAMRVRLYEGDRDVTAGGSGQAAVRGPSATLGYHDDPAADARLLTADGWLLLGDLIELDDDGYVRVVGRTADIIIRGGKNISAVAVEAEALSHPAIAIAAAIALPDPIFGERLCLCVQLEEGMTVDLDELVRHLEHRGVSREWFPERLERFAALPMSAGGKLDKQWLRDELARRPEA